MAGKRERADWARWFFSLFSFVLQLNYREKETKGQIEQIKMCRKKQHVRIDDVKEMPDLICGKSAVGGNYNLTRGIFYLIENNKYIYKSLVEI